MVAQPQKDDDLAPGKAACSGRVQEIRKPTGITLKLVCDKGDCPQGTGPCRPLETENKDPGTPTEWCGCSKDDPVRCPIHIERKKDGTPKQTFAHIAGYRPAMSSQCISEWQAAKPRWARYRTEEQDPPTAYSGS